MRGDSQQQVLRFDAFTLDLARCSLRRGDTSLPIRPKAFDMLCYLANHPGRLVSKDQLVERLCEWGEEVSNNAIEVYIHRLRKKIEQGPIRIATVRGLGYCLEKIQG